jgi:hypothetical protein
MYEDREVWQVMHPTHSGGGASPQSIDTAPHWHEQIIITPRSRH